MPECSGMGTAVRLAALVGFLAFAVQCRSSVPEGKEGAVTAADRVDVELLDIQSSLESRVYLRLEMRFTNPGTRPVKMKKYIVRWDGGSKEVVPEEPGLAAGESRISHVKIDEGDGNLDSLTRETARVEAILR